MLSTFKKAGGRFSITLKTAIEQRRSCHESPKSRMATRKILKK